MVYHCFTGVRTWASLGKAGITKIAYDFRRDRTTAQLSVTDKGSIDEHHMELGKAGITKIAYDFRRDLRTAQLCSCRQRIN